VAGAPGYVGAPALCAQAAGRAGAGIVNVALPRGLVTAVSTHVPEAAFILLPESDSPATARRAVELIAGKLERSKALVVGPGLGDDDIADTLLAALLGAPVAARRSGSGIGFASRGAEDAPKAGEAGSPTADKPMVIDADGLNWLAKQERWWDLLAPGTAVLTPHVGEMARLLGADANEITSDPYGTVRAAARDWRQTVVLKYGYTAVSDGERTLVADEAPTSLATAGSGDVFAGVIGAFLAQGLTPMDAAGLAIYLGCRAARRVEQRVGTLGLIASDLPFAVAAELALLEAKREASGA
jgi:NAD(P)H-hydrate repair Nnr-like enzyme with NAD(P)H-hydrate dehydratase domain